MQINAKPKHFQYALKILLNMQTFKNTVGNQTNSHLWGLHKREHFVRSIKSAISVTLAEWESLKIHLIDVFSLKFTSTHKTCDLSFNYRPEVLLPSVIKPLHVTQMVT